MLNRDPLTQLGTSLSGLTRSAHLTGTDVWYRSYRVPSDTRTTYQLGPNDPLTADEDVEDWGKRMAHFRADPLSARTFVLQADPEVGDDEEVQSVIALPAAPIQEWSEARPGVARGKLEMHRLHSELLENTRRVWIYTPPGYDPL